MASEELVKIYLDHLNHLHDDSESELDHPRRRKGAALEVDGVPHALGLIGELLNPR